MIHNINKTYYVAPDLTAVMLESSDPSTLIFSQITDTFSYFLKKGGKFLKQNAYKYIFMFNSC